MRVPMRAAIAALATAVLATSASALPVYTNDFEGAPPGAEWSQGTVSTTPGGATPSTRYLGQFGAGALTLTLSSLQPHSALNLALDLLLIQTWDGNGTFGGGPDRFTIDVDGTTLLDSTFANVIFQNQTYPGPTSSGQMNIPQTGAVTANTMGFTFNDQPLDALYRLNLSLPHTGDTAVIRFTSLQTEPVGDEGWGVDNIAVDLTTALSVNAIPVPVPSALLMSPLGAVIAVAGVRRFHRRA